MRKLPNTLRVLLAAGAAGAAAFVASGPLTAAAQGESVSSAQAASPTPCPSGVGGLLCTIGGGPTASPTPRPTATPSAAHSGTPPSHASPGAGAAPGKASPSSSATATPHATLAMLAARFANAPFLASLLDILSHPASSDQPDLVHFRVAAAAPQQIGAPGDGLPLTSAADPQTPAPAPSPDHRGWSILAALVAGLVAAALASAHTPGGRMVLRVIDARLGSLRSRPATVLSRLLVRISRGPRLHLAVVLAVSPAVIAFAVAGAAGTSRPAALAPQAAPPIAAGTGRADIVDDASLPSAALQVAGSVDGLPVWNQLLSIEQGIADQQDTLAGQETDLGRLARMAAAASVDDMVAPPPPGVMQAGVQQRIAGLVAAHDQANTQLRTNLQAEYDLYRAAAQDAVQQQQLLDGAAKAPVADAKQAVADDLARLQTQLGQEQVIADARAKLARIGSLTQKQLDAIQSHQAFIAPELGVITQPFGPTDFSMEPPLTFGGVFYQHFHTGIDIANALGNPIHAAADGIVIVATASTDSQGHLVGYGNYVVIAHPAGFITLYGHLDSLAVKAGELVHQGEIIGNEGSTGWSTGPHLHFEIRLGDVLLDPIQYLKGQLS